MAQVKAVTLQLSAKVGLLVTTERVHEPPVTVVMILLGHDIVGLMLSTTTTLNEQGAEVFPATSVTV